MPLEGGDALWRDDGAVSDERRALLGKEQIEALNASLYQCITLDRAALERSLAEAVGDADFYEQQIVPRANLFASAPVFLPRRDLDAMLGVVAAIEETARNPLFRGAVLAWAPEASRRDDGPRGAFMGYDFHLADGEPRLIEINTNAGGAFLNALLARAQLACCDQAEALRRDMSGGFEAAVARMFEREWRLAGRSGRPARIAIVDDDPERQFLFPEFVLARRVLEGQGIEAIIADAAELSYEAGALSHRGRLIDLVYNRLTDFALAEPRHAALRRAWLEQAVVVTPGPHAHALFADKRNLSVLTDPVALRGFGVPETTIETLSTIPRTEMVTSARAEELWARRKNLFFKPVSGFGGKAVYRGDKLTRSVWDCVLAGGYVAQEFAPPGERTVSIDGKPHARKVDVRLYTYDGALLLPAARLYQGQTTNFRTEGGGFAPVFFV